MNKRFALQDIEHAANLMREIAERWQIVDPATGELMSPERILDSVAEVRAAIVMLSDEEDELPPEPFPG